MFSPKLYLISPLLFSMPVFADSFTITGTVDESGINGISVGEHFYGRLWTDGGCQVCAPGVPGQGLTDLSIQAFGYSLDFASADQMDLTTFFRSSMSLVFVDTSDPALLIDPNGPGRHEFWFQESFDPTLPYATGHYAIALVPEPATSIFLLGVIGNLCLAISRKLDKRQ